MDTPPLYSRKEGIDFLILKDRVSRAADRRRDTNIPDSLGDHLVRMSLKMSLAIRTGEGRSELTIEANKLLAQAESEAR